MIRYLSPKLGAVLVIATIVIAGHTVDVRAEGDGVPTVTIQLEGAEGQVVFTPSSGQLKPIEEPSMDQGQELTGPVDFQNAFNGASTIQITQLEFNPDPFVLNNILVTNNTAATQVYTMGIALPTVFAAPNLISGTIDTDVIDGGTDGATLSSVLAFPIYAAQVDFIDVATLQNSPFTLVAPAGGTNNAVASFGPSLSAVPVAANIGIQLRFSLTPNDSASILSRFDVVVPEPASLGLGAMALVALVGIGWRRSRSRRQAS